MTDLVLLEREGEIARVTLNQPARLNAVNNQMWSRLGEIFADLDGDESLRCIILGGAGERAFSVGADISEFEQNRSSIEQARRYHERTHRSMQAILRCRHPVIARIRGLCVGGGLELATICDLRICGAGARFGIPVKRLGLVVSYAELQPLVDLIGPSNALEILLEGRIHDAGKRSAWVSSIAWSTTPRSSMRPSPAHCGSPRGRRWSRAGTRSSPAASCSPSRSARRRWTRASPASRPRTSAPATRPSSPSASPCSRAAEGRRDAARAKGRRALHRTRAHPRDSRRAARRGPRSRRSRRRRPAPVDEFHIRGRQATVELGEALGLTAGQDVLDVGSGIGGASRYFASTCGARITGIDLTPEYCELAARFARATGLADRLDYRQASALALPFADATFDAAYTQHVAMNIADKPALYAEVARVLKPAAVFGIYDILQGPGGAMVYPTPWADDASTSFLATPDELRRLLEAGGFRIEGWRDTTAAGRAFFATVLARVAEHGPPPLGLHLLLPDFRPRAENMLRGLTEDRIAVLQIICRKA